MCGGVGGMGGGRGSSTLLNSLWIHSWGMAPIRSLKRVCTVCSKLSVDHYNLKLSADNQSYRKSSCYWTAFSYHILVKWLNQHYHIIPSDQGQIAMFFSSSFNNLGIHMYRDACRYRCRNVQNPTVDRTCACICISTLYSNALKLYAESSMMYQ